MPAPLSALLRLPPRAAWGSFPTHASPSTASPQAVVAGLTTMTPRGLASSCLAGLPSGRLAPSRHRSAPAQVAGRLTTPRPRLTAPQMTRRRCPLATATVHEPPHHTAWSCSANLHFTLSYRGITSPRRFTSLRLRRPSRRATPPPPPRTGAVEDPRPIRRRDLRLYHGRYRRAAPAELPLQPHPCQPAPTSPPRLTLPPHWSPMPRVRV